MTTTNTITPIQTPRLSDTELEEIAAFLKGATLADPMLAQAWAVRAQGFLRRLIEEIEIQWSERGGELGAQIRLMLAEQIAKDLNGKVELTDETRLLSLGVHVLPDGVIVDSRLKVGRWQSEVPQ
jgi:hypothetical protein